MGEGSPPMKRAWVRSLEACMDLLFASALLPVAAVMVPVRLCCSVSSREMLHQ